MGATLLNAGLVCRYARSPQCPLEMEAVGGREKAAAAVEAAVVAFRADETFPFLASPLASSVLKTQHC